MTWQQIDKRLQDKLGASIYNLWITPLQCVSFASDTIELRGPDRFFCSWVMDNYMTDIQTAVQDYTGRKPKIIFKADDELTEAAASQTAAKSEQLCLPTISKTPTFVRTLNPRYVFDEFVVGDCNAIAHSACHALAEGDTSFGRCLYVSSSTGLGKSHLTHAVAHYILENAPGIRLNYLSAQQLTSEMVKSIQKHKMETFKTRFQSSDVLMLEDLQALAGRAKTQEELGSILDIIMESGKTVILTGVQPPRELSNITDGVRSRLSSGLITTITEPDTDTKAAIIAQKARGLKVTLSEELIWHIAERIKGDMRQVKSALVGIKAKMALRGHEANVEMVNEVMANIVNQLKALDPAMIRDYIARQFKLLPEELLSKSRKKNIAFPRQVSMYFSRKYTQNALSEIGRAFNRDHSTVVHSVRVISKAINNDLSIQGQIKMLDQKIRAKFLA